VPRIEIALKYLSICLLLLCFIPAANSQTPSFQLTPTYAGGNEIAVADFNRDGNLDIAVTRNGWLRLRALRQRGRDLPSRHATLCAEPLS